MEKRLLSGGEAAQYVGISTTTLWRLVSTGKIKRVKVKGMRPLYNVKELDDFIKRNEKYN